MLAPHEKALLAPTPRPSSVSESQVSTQQARGLKEPKRAMLFLPPAAQSRLCI